MWSGVNLQNVFSDLSVSQHKASAHGQETFTTEYVSRRCCLLLKVPLCFSDNRKQQITEETTKPMTSHHSCWKIQPEAAFDGLNVPSRLDKLRYFSQKQVPLLPTEINGAFGHGWITMLLGNAPLVDVAHN